MLKLWVYYTFLKTNYCTAECQLKLLHLNEVPFPALFDEQRGMKENVSPATVQSGVKSKSLYNYSEYERKTKARGKGTMTQQTDAFSVIVLWSIGAHLNYDELEDLRKA